MAARPRRPKIYRQRINPLDIYDERDFQARYRISKDIARELIVRYENSPHLTVTGDGRGTAITPEQRVNKLSVCLFIQCVTCL